MARCQPQTANPGKSWPWCFPSDPNAPWFFWVWLSRIFPTSKMRTFILVSKSSKADHPYRGEWKIIIGSKGLFCDLESTRRVCLCTLYPKPNPSKAISCVLSPKMNSPAHQTCDFMVKFGAENGHFWHISLLWHVAQI